MSIYTKDIPAIKNDPLTTAGDYTYGNISVERAYGGCKLDIGKFCSFGTGIRALFWGKHALGDITTYPFNMLHGQGWPPVQCTTVNGEDIHIGNNVWIANDVKIMQGARIEDGAVIGAFSVIKGRVKPYTLTVGNPAVVKKQLIPGRQIEALLEIKWWDWPVEMIKKHLAVINSPDADKLYEIWKSEVR